MRRIEDERDAFTRASCPREQGRDSDAQREYGSASIVGRPSPDDRAPEPRDKSYDYAADLALMAQGRRPLSMSSVNARRPT